jgi:hypothetical protein
LLFACCGALVFVELEFSGATEHAETNIASRIRDANRVRFLRFIG